MKRSAIRGLLVVAALYSTLVLSEAFTRKGTASSVIQRMTNSTSIITTKINGGARVRSSTRRDPDRRYRMSLASSRASDAIVSSKRRKAMSSPSSATGTATFSPSNIAMEQKLTWLRSIDGIVFVSYLCNILAITFPVMLLPMAAVEQVPRGTSIAPLVAAISSIATLGGAGGKFVNGFVCQHMGSYACSRWYFLGLSLCSVAFSLSWSPTAVSATFAAMEFFASMQWIALTVMLSNYYEKDASKLAVALTTLGLSSTLGQVIAKVLGMALSSAFHWRQVAQLGASMALLGSLLISRAPGRQSTTIRQRFQWASVTESLRAVLGSGFFWMVGLAHAFEFVARGTDRILGTFYQETASLPQYLCGGLTLSVTLGLLFGLLTGSPSFAKLSTMPQKKKFLIRRYAGSTAATLALALVARYGNNLIRSRAILTGVVALLSSAMTYFLAFQYFQFPARIAKRFGKHKAVCLSFLDGFGFLLSAPVFATTSKLVPMMGWSSAWIMLAALYATGGVLMMRAIPPILEQMNSKT